MSSAAQFFKVIQARDTAAVKRMLAAEPELASARNEKGQSALLLTVYGGNQELCDMLLAQGVPLELHEGAALGQLERVKQLVEKEPSQAESYSHEHAGSRAACSLPSKSARLARRWMLRLQETPTVRPGRDASSVAIRVLRIGASTGGPGVAKRTRAVAFPAGACYLSPSLCGRSSVGRVRASQARCRRFDPGRPL